MKIKLNKKTKIILITAGAVAVIIAGLVTAKTVSLKKKAPNVLYTVKQEVYQNAINVAGVVSAAQSQTLQALSSGTVMNVYVKQGDSVKKGDLIIQLDDTEQQYNLAKHDYDMETTKINGSMRQLKLKETERLSLLQKISDRKVTATFDGIIADIDASVGDSLEAKDSVGTLVDISYLTAEVEIAETDVSKLKVGQQVEFTFPSYREKVYGYVLGWPAIGEVTSRGATIVKARLRIDEYPEVILPNFSFTGKIKISPDENYLIVNRLAIGRENRQAFVVKKDGGKTEVKVVPYDREYVKITEGNVSEDDVLIAQSGPQKSGQAKNNAQRNGMPPMGPGAAPARRP